MTTPPSVTDTSTWPSADVWNELAARGGNLFSTREWAECWVRHHLDEGDRVHVLVDDEQAPRVIVPVHVSGGLVRQVRLLGHGPADQLGPVCAPEDRPYSAW